MLNVPFREIFVVQHQVDMRKSFDGLLAEARQLLLSPYDGDVVVFVGKSKRIIKTLFGDNKGLWLVLRRFDAGALRTEFRFLVDPSFVQVTQAELMLLMEGSAYQITDRAPSWKPSY